MIIAPLGLYLTKWNKADIVLTVQKTEIDILYTIKIKFQKPVTQFPVIDQICFRTHTLDKNKENGLTGRASTLATNAYYSSHLFNLPQA